MGTINKQVVLNKQRYQMNQGGRGAGKKIYKEKIHWQEKALTDDSLDAFECMFSTDAVPEFGALADLTKTVANTEGAMGVLGVQEAMRVERQAEDIIRKAKDDIQKKLEQVMLIFSNLLQKIKIELDALDNSGLKDREPFLYIEEKAYLDKQYFDVCELMADKYTLSCPIDEIEDIIEMRGFTRGA